MKKIDLRPLKTLVNTLGIPAAGSCSPKCLACYHLLVCLRVLIAGFHITSNPLCSYLRGDVETPAVLPGVGQSHGLHTTRLANIYHLKSNTCVFFSSKVHSSEF